MFSFLPVFLTVPFCPYSWPFRFVVSICLLYLIECGQCKKQYVGETDNALHRRVNGHRSDSNLNRPDRPVAEHFNIPGHRFAGMKIMVIEQMGLASAARRKDREAFWRYTLRTMAPDGMNQELGRPLRS